MPRRIKKNNPLDMAVITRPLPSIVSYILFIEEIITIMKPNKTNGPQTAERDFIFVRTRPLITIIYPIIKSLL